MGSAPEEPSYLIVGAGCFGASTALYLSQNQPSSKITLIDRAAFPNPTAAAHDINKIIRADYPDLVYMKLGLEAQEQWRHDKIYSPYYHESGMLFAENLNYGRSAMRNYKTIQGDKIAASILTSEEARERFGGIFKDANWDGVTENFYNPRSGWGEADNALRSVVQSAVDNGVKYIADGVASLLIDQEDRSTKGVKTQTGEILHADHIVLCTGAYTASLLADSNPHNKNFQSGGRLVAAAAVSCYIRLPKNRRARFQNAPVMFNGLDHTHGECIPPTSDGLLKFNFELSFTNNVTHKASGQTISVPPSRHTQSTWSQDVPEPYKQDVLTVIKHIYGKELDGLEPENYRMCWDAVTPNQDWIISPHPHSRNLYVATGGSFHAWKFLPNIGKYITQMLDGTLNAEMSRKWAWYRADEGAACEMYIPARDLNDVV